MRKLVVNTFVTLDGVMQAPGGPEEDTAGGFEHGGWSFGYWDEAMGQWMGETMGKPFALLLGRKTYEIFAAYWPNAGDQPGSAELNAATKYVASRTLDSVDWANSVLLEGDAAESVARLKEEDGPEVQVHGSSDLIQTLLANQLRERSACLVEADRVAVKGLFDGRQAICAHPRFHAQHLGARDHCGDARGTGLHLRGIRTPGSSELADALRNTLACEDDH